MRQRSDVCICSPGSFFCKRGSQIPPGATEPLRGKGLSWTCNRCLGTAKGEKTQLLAKPCRPIPLAHSRPLMFSIMSSIAAVGFPRSTSHAARATQHLSQCQRWV